MQRKLPRHKHLHSSELKSSIPEPTEHSWFLSSTLSEKSILYCSAIQGRKQDIFVYTDGFSASWNKLLWLKDNNHVFHDIYCLYKNLLPSRGSNNMTCSQKWTSFDETHKTFCIQFSRQIISTKINITSSHWGLV